MDLIWIKLGSSLDYVNSHTVRRLTVPYPSFTEQPDPSCSSGELYGIHRLDIPSQIWCASTASPQGQSQREGKPFQGLVRGALVFSTVTVSSGSCHLDVHNKRHWSEMEDSLCSLGVFLQGIFFSVQHWWIILGVGDKVSDSFLDWLQPPTAI